MNARGFSLLRPGLVALGICAAVLGAVGTAGADDATFQADCEALCAASHRLCGTAEGKAAAKHVTDRLRQLLAGIEGAQVVTQPFATAQTRVQQCTMTADDGAVLTLRPMRPRPNGIVPASTPADGIRGELLSVGRGRLEDYGNHRVSGRIVVLDYNCQDNWLRAFRLGARAVVFTQSGSAEAWHAHYLDADVNIPRFYYDGPASDLPLGRSATIRSEILWEAAIGQNVYAFLPGTDPTFHLERPEVIVVAAALDSFGEVPTLSPGARGAANVAGLLALCEQFATAPVRRDLLFAFFDGRARGHLGASAFYRALETDVEEMSPAARLVHVDTEREFVTTLVTLAGEAQPLDQQGEVRAELVRRLSTEGAERVFDFNHELLLLREARRSEDEGSAARERLDKLIAAKNHEKNLWNDLRRALALDNLADPQLEAQLAKRLANLPEAARPTLPAAMATVKERLATAMKAVRVSAERRLGELAEAADMLTADAELAALLTERTIVLHATMMLGDRTSRWGVVTGGDSFLHSHADNPGLYAKHRKSFSESWNALSPEAQAASGFLSASVDGSMVPARALWAAPFLVHSGEVAGRVGTYNVAFCTMQEDVRFEGTPDDRLDKLDSGRIRAQAAGIGMMLRAVADVDGLSLRQSIQRDVRYSFPEFNDGRIRGALAMGRRRGSSMPNKPAVGAIVRISAKAGDSAPETLLYQPIKPYGFDNMQLCRADTNGSYSFGPITADARKVVGFAATFDARGQVTAAADNESQARVYNRLNLVTCRAGFVALPSQVDPTPATVMDGMTNGRLIAAEANFGTRDGVVFWYCKDNVDAIKLFGPQAAVALVNGPAMLPVRPPGAEVTRDATDDGTGVGLSLAEPAEESTSSRGAADLWRLNDQRVQMLRDRGVVNSSLEELHGRAEDLMTEADASDDVLGREARTVSSLLSQGPVYDALRQSLDDLVHAVILLLALCVPFAFAMERLLIGATNVYRQIIGFCSFFIVTFLILFFTHPAFAISKTPIVIFLGFTIIILSSLVIFIIMQKFSVELKVMQGLESSVHAADVSRFGTVVAAMSMGISSMRRRPLRTTLTAVTIILLTFTILCFASFETHTGIVGFFSRPSPNYSGVLLHRVSWRSMTPDVVDIVRGRWPTKGTVCPRRWVISAEQEPVVPLLSTSDGSRIGSVRGILGIDLAELALRPDIASLLQADAERADDYATTVWMTTAMATRLEVDPGDLVLLGGKLLTVGQPFSAVQASAVKDMDGSDIVPVDFTEMSAAQDAAVVEDDEAASAGRNWAPLPIDSVVIVDSRVASSLGAALHAVNIYTADNDTAVELAEDLARMLPLPVNATRSDGVYRHMLGAKLKASGARDLLFPVLLGGLVIFGTMLGSVADREREIYTFSALGLAPQHVAGLFFTEAMVYSVIGGMSGYLLAQGSLTILTGVATYTTFRIPEMNYSSTNAIVTILLVMVTVLISAIYPAIKASRSANPGVMRSWRVPRAAGDRLDIVFPFTVSAYDITGVVSFLKEHFGNFSDTGLGVFMASEVRLVHDSEQVGLAAHLTLAPFDLGVTQDFELHSAPSEIEGVDEVNIAIVRRSGQPKDWERLNRVLLDDLRRQFLLWRALPAETMELYRQRTLIELGPDEHDDERPEKVRDGE
jgi:hypothetical protein